MQPSNNTVLNSADLTFTDNVAYGKWFELWRYTNWTLHVMNLESDGTIDVWISNEGQRPPANVQDVLAFKLITLMPVSSTVNDFFQGGSNTAQWIMLSKNQGGTPLPTIVNLQGVID